MSGGPLLPSSVYLGGGSGYLYPAFYVPSTNTNAAGQIEGIGVVGAASSAFGGSDTSAVLQFNMPESIPSGTLKLRCLTWASVTSGTAKLTIKDGTTSVLSNIGVATLTTETQLSQTWTTADVIVENKISLTTSPSPTANQILTILATFNTSGWTLNTNSVWQFSVVWE